MKWLRFSALACTIVFLNAGCATGMYRSDGTPNDPWEHFNRDAFRFNDKLDRWLLKPVAQTYHDVTPEPVRNSVRNFFSNLSEVDNMANGVLQANARIFFISLARFLLNTTLGLAGFLDPASSIGLPQQQEDFGKTFAAWGFKSGPFIMLPFLGPSTFRDTLGLPGDWYVGISRHIEDNYTRWGLRFIDLVSVRDKYLGLDKFVFGDRYTAVRDVWLQTRSYQIHGAPAVDPFALDSVDYVEPTSSKAPVNSLPTAPEKANIDQAHSLVQ